MAGSPGRDSVLSPDVEWDRWGSQHREGVTAAGVAAIRVRHRGGCANIDSF